MESENLLPFERIQRKILVKREAETSPKFGKKPEERTIQELLDYGIINLDKPKGPTSHQVVHYLKEILGLEKAGHSGTLDPGVTGVLPISLGRSTKVMQYLLTAGKEYVAIMHLHKDVHPDRIHDARKSFLGTIKQLPPVRSAIVRRWRERKIYYFDIMEIDGKDVLFRVGTEAGTYIRKLIHDFGKFLDTGANMSELRRTKAGPFKEGTLVTLLDVSDAFWLYKEKNDDSQIRKIIMPIENAIAHLPKIYVFDTSVDTLCHGANLNIPGVAKLDSGIEPDQAVALMTLKNELIALGRGRLTSNKIISLERGLAATTDKVLMEPGTYPKISPK